MKQEYIKTVNGDLVKILGSKGEYYKIEFVNTGHKCRAMKHLVDSGNIIDPTPYLEDRNSWKSIHKEFTSNSGETFKAFQEKGRKYKIEFPCGYVTEVYKNNAVNGKVRNPMTVSLYGEGVIGVIDKNIPYWKQARQLWSNMIKRCYDPNYEGGYYGRAFVDNRWKTFENFLIDIKHLKGFSGWLEGKKGGVAYNLDKDFYKPNNDIYSRYTCQFLPEGVNKAQGKLGKTQKDWA